MQLVVIIQVNMSCMDYTILNYGMLMFSILNHVELILINCPVCVDTLNLVSKYEPDFLESLYRYNFYVLSCVHLGSMGTGF